MALWLIALLHLVQASPDAEELFAVAILRKLTGKCLEATASGVVLAPCQNTSSQHWHKHERMLVNLADGRCLEWDPSKVAEYNIWHRGKVHMTECTGATKQLWDMDTGIVRNGLASSLCLHDLTEDGNAIGVVFCSSDTDQEFYAGHNMRLKTPAHLQKLFKPRKEEPPEAKAEPEKSHKESMELINILQEQVKKLEAKLSESHESHVELKRGLREQAEKVPKERRAELERSHAEVTKNLTEHMEHVKSRLEELEKKSRNVNGEQEPKAQINLAELLKMDHTKDVQSAFIESLAKCFELRLVYVGFPLALFFAVVFFWRQPRQDLKRDLLEPLHEEIQEMRKSHGLAAELELRRLGQVQEKDKEGQLQQVLMQLVIEMKESRKERDTSMTLLKQLQETVAGSDASSECTVGSWALVSSGEP